MVCIVFVYVKKIWKRTRDSTSNNINLLAAHHFLSIKQLNANYQFEVNQLSFNQFYYKGKFKQAILNVIYFPYDSNNLYRRAMWIWMLFKCSSRIYALMVQLHLIMDAFSDVEFHLPLQFILFSTKSYIPEIILIGQNIYFVAYSVIAHFPQRFFIQIRAVIPIHKALRAQSFQMNCIFISDCVFIIFFVVSYCKMYRF